MREHYGKEAQKHIDSVVADAARREAELINNIQAGAVDPALRQQLEQVRRDAECARQEVENWRRQSTYLEDRAAQADAQAEELAEKLAASGGRSGAETLTFLERCAPHKEMLLLPSVCIGCSLRFPLRPPVRRFLTQNPPSSQALIGFESNAKTMMNS